MPAGVHLPAFFYIFLMKKYNKFQKFLGKLGPFKWTVHNLIAHPLSEFIHITGLCTSPAENLSNWVHDITVPEHETRTGRG